NTTQPSRSAMHQDLRGFCKVVRRIPFQEPQGAAGILPADQSEESTAGKMPAAPWRCRPFSSWFRVPMHPKKRKGLFTKRNSQIRMTNDETRRNTEIRMTKPPIVLLSVVRHSSFGFLSSFDNFPLRDEFSH